MHPNVIKAMDNKPRVTYWCKTESFSSKIRKRTRMPAFIASA